MLDIRLEMAAAETEAIAALALHCGGIGRANGARGARRTCNVIAALARVARVFVVIGTTAATIVFVDTNRNINGALVVIITVWIVALHTAIVGALGTSTTHREDIGHSNAQ